MFLSGLSSLVIIGKVSVENFLDKHKDQVSKCSPQGKIVLACTALPAFLLVTIFKIGSLAVMHPGAVFVGHALSGLTLLVLKLCRFRKYQELTSINQSIIAEILTLQWRVFISGPKAEMVRQLEWAWQHSCSWDPKSCVSEQERSYIPGVEVGNRWPASNCFSLPSSTRTLHFLLGHLLLSLPRQASDNNPT